MPESVSIVCKSCRCLFVYPKGELNDEEIRKYKCVHCRKKDEGEEKDTRELLLD